MLAGDVSVGRNKLLRIIRDFTPDFTSLNAPARII